ncbi:uncharacterized protein B0P05DRAFT_479739 [Gilbertella persicaria]|uniref:uncharacterized protein n=1 Tax=Gilbertella persicaria TaxID=101096 RepID=UPI0022206FB3|nr:uncharacterized protein B0P05DRAFT_479739 [Gilbertella persicaria]KAI8053117.1 hypothetical protein B0P05DRAFT_479739 [Gilbertella persicaria]
MFSTPLFIAPTLLFLFVTLVGFIRNRKTKDVNWQDISATPNRRLSAFSKSIIVLASFVPFFFLLDVAVLVARVLLEENGQPSMMLAYYIVLSWLAWVVSLVCLMDESHKFSRWYWLQYTFFALAFLAETSVGWLWYMEIKPEGVVLTIYDKLLLAAFLVRYIIVAIILCLSFIHMIYSNNSIRHDETSPLLDSHPTYGATVSEVVVTTAKEKSSFHDFWSKFIKVFPYIWPHHNFKLQQLVILCFLLMCLGLAINVLTPLQIGYVVDRLNNDPKSFAWAAVLAYVGFKFLQGSSGLIQALQNYLWIPVGQYTTREISVKLFAHLHNLSLHYHINRKTGEVLRTVDRGTNSVVQLLSQIVFQIFPALANILVAVVVFSVKFSLPFGLIVFVTMALYLYVTITLTEWRTGFRRKMNELDNYARSKAVDSLLNFETVKYYNAEQFEVNRYNHAIVDYQKADYINSVSLNVLNLAQNAVITGGLLAGSLLFAFQVSKGKLTPGDFVSFNVYMMQLYIPLHFFGTYYRMIQQNFVDMEKMFDLFEVEQTVKDAEDATELQVTEGHVKFDKVSFSYDHRQTALNNISFSIPRGATVALVGPSGGGKSTILRLLFRFYDPNAGHIYIDSQDIAGVKQASLRKNIGVVPQDTVLFNDTVMYNIRYGDVNASDEDVYRAAKAAQIHDKILSFPDGYDTKVGERGLRLSGGEKQRVAIARTLLKDPAIILLDEATSALDTTTERHIQGALSAMTKDRTTLIIAHRLSTIVSADLILVIKDGQVVESGSHDQLIQGALAGENQGAYYEMWQKQLDDHHDTSQTASETATPKPLEVVEEPESFIGENDQKKKAQKEEEIVREAQQIQQQAKEAVEESIQEQVETEEIQEQEEAQGISTDTKQELEHELASSNNSPHTSTANSSANNSDSEAKKEISMTPVDQIKNNSKTRRNSKNKKKKKKNSRK